MAEGEAKEEGAYGEGEGTGVEEEGAYGEDEGTGVEEEGAYGEFVENKGRIYHRFS